MESMPPTAVRASIAPEIIEAELRAAGLDVDLWAGTHGMTRGELRAMLTGDRPARVEILHALADALGVSVDVLRAA